MISIVAEYKDVNGHHHVMFTTTTVERAKELVNNGGWVYGRTAEDPLDKGWKYQNEPGNYDAWHAEVRGTGATYRIYGVEHKE